jgi:hypothetical protein
MLFKNSSESDPYQYSAGLTGKEFKELEFKSIVFFEDDYGHHYEIHDLDKNIFGPARIVDDSITYFCEDSRYGDADNVPLDQNWKFFFSSSNDGHESYGIQPYIDARPRKYKMSDEDAVVKITKDSETVADTTVESSETTEEARYPDDEIVVFNNYGFEEAIREWIKIPSGDIKYRDVKNIKNLKIEGTDTLLDGGDLSALNYFTNLESLDFQIDYTDDYELNFENCMPMNKLKVLYFYIFNTGINESAKNPSNSIVDLGNLSAPNLEEIHVDASQLRGLSAIGNNPHMTSFEFYGNAQSMNTELNSVAELGNLPALENFGLAVCPNLESLNGVTFSDKLENVSIGSCHSLKDISAIKAMNPEKGHVKIWNSDLLDTVELDAGTGLKEFLDKL